MLIHAGALDYAVELLCSTDTASPLVFRAIAVVRLLAQGQGRGSSTHMFVNHASHPSTVKTIKTVKNMIIFHPRSSR